jgi:hypothetical protein
MPDNDQAWIQRFYAAVPNATVLSYDPQVETGPDYFPYFQMAVPSLARVVTDHSRVCSTTCSTLAAGR